MRQCGQQSRGVISRLSVRQNHLVGLLKHRWLGTTFAVSDSVDLGMGSRIYYTSTKVHITHMTLMLLV